MKKIFLPLLQRLSSRLAVGGLEISDSAIRFLRIEGEKIVTASLRLPPGIILDGKINDRQNFLTALKNIYSQLTKTKSSQKIHAIICLPASVVYSQDFTVPVINQEDIEEAVELNLRMISPINLEKAYSDWQIIGGDTHQREILGAFVENSIVDDYDRCLRESGFLPVAFEFPALAFTRLIKELGPETDPDKSYLAVNISTDGLDFLIFRKQELYFNHFLFWRTIQGEKRQIDFSNFKSILVQEIQKIVNFVSTNYQESFEGVIIITPALEKEVGEIIQTEFGLKIIPLRLRRYNNFSAVWLTTFGSALRGLIPRRQDTFISLTTHNVIEDFYHEQVLSFIILWRNILLTSLLVLVVAFSGIDIFLIRVGENVKNQFSSSIVRPQIKEINELQEKAKHFNELVDLIAAAKQSTPEWSSFFEQLNKAAGNQVIFDRIFIQSLSVPVRIQGRADNEKIIFNFKNILASQLNLGGVEMALTSIRPTPDNRMSFEISFVIKSLTP